MDRAMLQQYLAKPRRMPLSVSIMSPSSVSLSPAWSEGYDITEARRLLALFEEPQVLHVAHRDRLRRELDARPG